jgi:hypothetical protein
MFGWFRRRRFASRHAIGLDTATRIVMDRGREMERAKNPTTKSGA